MQTALTLRWLQPLEKGLILKLYQCFKSLKQSGPRCISDLLQLCTLPDSYSDFLLMQLSFVVVVVVVIVVVVVVCFSFFFCCFVVVVVFDFLFYLFI